MNYVHMILEYLVPPLAAGLGLLVPVVFAWLALYLKRRLGIEVTLRDQELWSRIALDALAYAEEWAGTRRRAGEHPDGASKMRVALEFVSQQIRRYKLDTRAREYAAALIEAQLGKLHAGLPPAGTVMVSNFPPPPTTVEETIVRTPEALP